MDNHRTQSIFPQFKLPHPLMSRPVDVLAVGNAKLEMVVGISAWPQLGQQQEVEMALPVYSAGGCATNVACQAARLGGNAALVCRLGDGRYCRPVLEEIRSSGVSGSYIHFVNGREGNLMIISTNPEGDWMVMTYKDEGLELRLEDIPPKSEFQRVKMVHIDGFSLDSVEQKNAIETAIQRAHANGCLVSVDAAVPVAKVQPEYLAYLFQQADLVFANLFEAQAVTATSSVDEAVNALRTMGPAVSVLKMGKEGSLVITPQAIGEVEAYPVKVVDTIAAGDSYIAAMLTSLCDGLSLQESARHGSAAGALACLGAGSLTYRFTLDDVLSMVSKTRG